MTTNLWMTTRQVADESGRAYDSVARALQRRLLTGHQPCPRGTWRISRKAFEAWMAKGAPIDTPAKARLRRSA
ncbi:MAG: hypothetical protein WBA97_34285 [Actinophytocola sp.]|uniref:hypothetical protein n=1 Tax=Actinophytocola sp. TaxID=1872138 RepID=UPI003C76B1E6